MIIVHKGGFNILGIYVNVCADVELTEEQYFSDFSYSQEYSNHIESIANNAVKKYAFNDIKTYGILGESIKNYISVYSDDVYDYPTIQNMLEQRYSQDNSTWQEKWNEKFETLEEHIENVEDNDTKYKVYIHIFIDK